MENISNSKLPHMSNISYPLISFVFGCALLAIILPGGLDAVYAAAACSSCHSDGRTGTPPATPTHIRMGLVAAPGAKTTTATASKSAGGGATASAATASKPAFGASKPASTATRTAAVAGGNGGSCSGCHSDGRSGMTPPGHRATTGMNGNGAAPPKKSGGTKVAKGGAAGAKPAVATAGNAAAGKGSAGTGGSAKPEGHNERKND